MDQQSKLNSIAPSTPPSSSPHSLAKMLAWADGSSTPPHVTNGLMPSRSPLTRPFNSQVQLGPDRLPMRSSLRPSLQATSSSYLLQVTHLGSMLECMGLTLFVQYLSILTLNAHLFRLKPFPTESLSASIKFQLNLSPLLGSRILVHILPQALILLEHRCTSPLHPPISANHVTHARGLYESERILFLPSSFFHK